MRNPLNPLYRINTQIVAMMVVLFLITAVTVSMLNRGILRGIFEANYTHRNITTNAMLATIVDSDSVKYYVDLLSRQDEAFRQRQIDFNVNREALAELQSAGAALDAQRPYIDRMEAFHKEMDLLKLDDYWETLAKIRTLKEVSELAYVYIIAFTGVVMEDGTLMYSYIFDADDVGIYDDPSVDGLGTVNVAEAEVLEVQQTGIAMDRVIYYDDFYGELYFTFAPILDEDGNVVAILGSDVDLGEMNLAIRDSMRLFTTVFLICTISFIVVIYFIIRRYIVRPLRDLTGTARQLADGSIYAAVPESTLGERSELGVLAHAIKDLSGVYQKMVSSTGALFSAANVGRLNVRSDTSEYKGDIKKVMEQINDTLDAMTFYLDSVPEGILIMNESYELLFRNKQFAGFFGDMGAEDFIETVFTPDKDDGDVQAAETSAIDRFHEVIKQPNNSTTVWIDHHCFSVTVKEVNLSKMSEVSVMVIAMNITDLMREREFAQNDPLTGVFNRRYFMELAKIGMDNAKRLGEICCVTMLDIDKFKDINDTHGHLIGDKILIELAARVGTQVRPLDFFARFGGEEFMIFSSHTAYDGARTMAERLRLCLCNKPYEDSGRSISFSASFGVAMIEEDDVMKAIGNADKALYQAKEAGRNKVVLFGD